MLIVANYTKVRHNSIMESSQTDGLQIERKRRVVALSVIAAAVVASLIYSHLTAQPIVDNASTMVVSANEVTAGTLAGDALQKLEIKGRAPKTGYSRSQFGNGWAAMGNCTMRDWIMARDFAETKYVAEGDCSVEGGTLNVAYTAKTIIFSRANASAVQIDHVIALSDAWQKGAQQLTPALRAQLANDPLELIAVDGPANGEKSDADAASWLPPNKAYRCRYIARQIAVKQKYHLWITQSEHDVMRRILDTCPQQVLPIEAKAL